MKIFLAARVGTDFPGGGIINAGGFQAVGETPARDDQDITVLVSGQTDVLENFLRFLSA